MERGASLKRLRAAAIAARAGRLARRGALAALALLLIAVSGCASLDTKQREWMCRPNQELVRTPADYGLAFEELWLAVPGGDGSSQRVHGWWIPGDTKAPALLYLHGSRWNIGNNLFRIARLQRMGYSVLAIDYRGFGRSDGDLPSETQAYEDAQAGWTELVRRVPEPSRRVIYGHSLGGAVGIELALRHPEAAALVAESTFTSIRAMVDQSQYGFLPLGVVLTQHFDSIAKVPKLRVPVMFVHGAADRWVPSVMSEQLYAAAPEPKRLMLVEGASHSNVTAVAFDDLQRALGEFLAGAATRLSLGREPAMP